MIKAERIPSHWLAIATCAAALLAIHWISGRFGWVSVPLTDGPYLYAASASNGVVVTDPSAPLSVVSYPISPIAGEALKVEVRLRSISEAYAEVHVDLAAEGWDDSRHERRLNIDGEANRLRSVEFPTGNPPDGGVQLRLFEFDPASVEVTEVSAFTRPARIGALAAVLAWCVTIATLALLLRTNATARLQALVKTTSLRIRETPAFGALLLALICTFGFALYQVRASMLGGPFVFADETSYLLLALANGDVSQLPQGTLIKQLPNYLYFEFLGPLVNEASDPLPPARLLNSAFMVFLCVSAFAIVRACGGYGGALIVALAVLVMPSGIYAGYLTPEIAFIAVCVAAAAQFVRAANHSALTSLVACGVLLGISVLFKPHGYTMIAGFTIAAPLVWSATFKSRLRAVSCLLIPAVTAAAGLTALLAPQASAGSAVLGGYAELLARVGQPLLESERRLDFLRALAANGGLALLFCGAPIAAACSYLSRWNHTTESQGASALRALFVLVTVLVALHVGATAWFTAMAVGAGPYETADRLHQRYYDAALLITAIGGAALLLHTRSLHALPTAGKTGARPRLLILLALVPAAWAAWLASTTVVQRANFVDSPWAFALAQVSVDGVVLGAFALSVCTVVAAAWPQIALAGWATVVIAAGSMGHAAAFEAQAGYSGHDAVQRAARATRATVGESDLNRLVILYRQGESSVYRALFHLGDSVRTQAVGPNDAEWPNSCDARSTLVLALDNVVAGDRWVTTAELPGGIRLLRCSPDERE